jgi:mediator of RNA polymerase II transcription subunit 30
VKAQEQLKTLRVLFKRLRLIYDKCNDNCQGMEYTHIEVGLYFLVSEIFYLLFSRYSQSLIPLKDEWDMKSDEKKSSEVYKQSCDEHNEIMEVCNFFF